MCYVWSWVDYSSVVRVCADSAHVHRFSSSHLGFLTVVVVVLLLLFLLLLFRLRDTRIEIVLLYGSFFI